MISEGRKRGLLKVVGKAVTLGTALLMAAPLDALACTQVYVGPKLTDTGNVYIGRSEDYAPRHPKAFGVQLPRTNPTFSSDESNFSWTFKGTTYRHTYVRDLPSGWNNRTDAYSEAGTNEKGVSVSATLTTDQNDKISAVDPTGNANEDNPSGIGEYTIPDVVLGCSATARDGVKLLGSLIEKQGAYDNNQVIIADPHETWLFMMLSGHQWAAINLTAVVPDKASVNPNIGCLKFKVDLANDNLCLHSKDVEKVAKDAGSAKYFTDGSFDIASSYGSDDPGVSQWTRYVQGHVYFGAPLKQGEFKLGSVKGKYSVSEGVTSVTDPQLFFTPGKKNITLFDAQKALCARGEGIKGIDANANPNVYAVGNNRTVEGHMYQIRQGKSADIATIQWENLSRCEFGVFVPSYSALLTKVNTKLYPINGKWSEAPKGPNERDNVSAAMDEKADDGSLEYVMMNINTLAYNNRATFGKPVHQYLNALQKQLNAQHVAVDTLMQATPADKRSSLANKAHEKASLEVYAKTKQLLDEMRTYLKHTASFYTADTPELEPFVPSDLNTETGDLKKPLSYAAGIVAPVIDKTSKDVNVEVGGAAKLEVTAHIPEGGADSASKLSYAWYNAKDPSKKLGESATLDANTAEEGTNAYYVVVTNTESGESVKSNVITVAVKKAQETKPDATTKPDTNTTSSSTTKPDTNTTSSSTTKPNSTTTTGTSNNSAATNNNAATSGTQTSSKPTPVATTTKTGASRSTEAPTSSLPKTGDATHGAIASVMALTGVACGAVALEKKRFSA